MYYNIEKEYQKNNPNRRFNMFYWKLGLFLSIVFLGLNQLEINPIILFLTFMISLISVVIVYTIIDSKEYLQNAENVKGIAKKN